MRFYCYCRKSVFSDHSDSIDNQERMCREYVDLKFPNQVDSWETFSDEDFSGSNTNRPDYQRMIDGIKSGLCDIVIVYQLDRFSRNVRDFSEAYEIMREHHVRFICLDLNIDTSSPIGEAMMYVSAAFGQMERRNTAQRVTDNMIGLAQKGFWVGGNPPIGYVRRPILIDGRKHVTIEIDPDAAEYVKMVYRDFTSGKYTLQGLSTHYRHAGIRTYHGNYFSTSTMHKMLKSPYCCPATPEVYNYYVSLGCAISDARERWDGSHGVMIYGRYSNTGRKTSAPARKNPPERWTVCVGYHKPFIDADIWLKAQELLCVNKFTYQTKYPPRLLKGIVRCTCGSILSVRKGKVNHCTGHRSPDMYTCLRRERQGKETCSMPTIHCDVLDQVVTDIVYQIDSDPSAIFKYLTDNPEEQLIDTAALDKQIDALNARINRLTVSLSMIDQGASDYIITEINKLSGQVHHLKVKRTNAAAINRKSSASRRSRDSRVKEIRSLLHNFDSFDAFEQNRILKSIIKSCVWDGSTLHLSL